MSTTAVVNLADMAAQWRAARRIYPIYSTLVRQYKLGEPCRELESPINRSESEVLCRVAQWFEQMDDKIHVWQLRQLLQTTQLSTEENLRALLLRYKEKKNKTREVRDKVDYLFVQYYAHCAPHEVPGTRIDFDHVADVLRHVAGDVAQKLPDFCSGLDPILADLDSCASLGDLLSRKIVERAREIKDSAGEQYFLPAVLVTFVRFNYLLRLGFFRLMHADLHAIRVALHEMEARGQTECDCSNAGLSASVSMSELRQICHDWKAPFRAAYSAGNNLKHLVAIRAALEEALKRPLPASQAERVSEPVNTVVPHAKSATLPAAAPVSTEKVEPKPTPAQKTTEAIAPKPFAKTADTTAMPATPITTLDNCLEQIAEQLLKTPGSSATVSNVMMGQTKLLLASWEVAAFVKGGDDICDALQRAVAARAILNLNLDRQKRGESADVAGAVAIAHEEAAQMQERIAAAKDAKNIDAAVNLAATAKRLLSLIAEAEKK